MARITVVGAGISGLTVALTLAELGQQVRIVAARRVDRGGLEDPLVASFFPAASVFPVSVGLDRMAETVAISRRVFRTLERRWPVTVRRQRHLEVVEGVGTPPDGFGFSADEVHEASEAELGGLRRCPGVAVSAWIGRIAFVEIPPYVALVSAELDRLGVEIEERQLASGELPTDADAVVVCAGAGAPQLTGDSQPGMLLRGHLIHLPPQAIEWPGGEPTSFHYTPPAEVFSQPDGRVGDAYFYPRRDAWLLGGSRQPGRIVDGSFVVEGNEGPTTLVDGVAVPSGLLEVHRGVLRQWLGVDLAAAAPRVRVGIRYARDPDGAGIRLEAEQREGRLVVYDYGHGGAGVTLSWGCAVRVAALLRVQGLEVGGFPGSELGHLLAEELDSWIP